MDRSVPLRNFRKFALIGLVLVSLIGSVLWGQRRRAEAASKLSEPLARGSISEAVYGIGTVTARNSFQLRLGVSAYVQKLYVREGDRVQKGDRVADLDQVSFRAPFAGTVTSLPAKVGETVAPQAIVLAMADLLDRYLIVTLEQRGALRVKQGQTARISFDSLRDASFTGTVESIYSSEGNFLVRIGVKDLPDQILPGMTGDVAIEIAQHPDALLLPVAALDNGLVRVSRGGTRTTPVEVKTGIIDGAFAEILAGDLREGDRVVLPKRATP